MLNDADNRRVAPDLLVAGEKHRRPDFVYAATNGRRGSPPARASHRFPWARRAVLRSGWDGQACYAFFETAPFGYGHQHEDALTFELHAYGQPLVGTMGRYTYAQVPLRNYLISSLAHNVILVDGQGQNQRSLRADLPPTDPRPEAWLAREETADPFVTTPDLDVAYGLYPGPWTGGLQNVTWERWLAFLKPSQEAERPALWVIRDRVSGEGGGSHNLTFLLHFFPGWIRIDDDTGYIVTDYGSDTGNLLVGIANPTGLLMDGARGKELPPRGWYSDEYGKIEPAWEVRAVRSVELPYDNYMVFVPFHGTNVPQVEIYPIASGVIVEVNGTGWQVKF
jgi:hypothetical protein